MTNSTKFFVNQREQSKVKTAILTKYFGAWAQILIPRSKTGRVAYIDLFSGPGKFETGENSTPLIILEKCIKDDKLRKSVVTVFNDADPKFVEELQKNIQSIPNIDTLTYKPQILNSVVSDEIAKIFSEKNLIPTLAFIDPWGYKGLTTNLINALIKDFGSDCIFFFNYNRISMGLNNPLVKEHMDALFGLERADEMRIKVKNLTPEEKELYIVNELAETLSDNRANYVLPFRFLDENKNKTSHYLIFVSKHVLGYSIMKDIMASESTLKDDGVASFSYIPVKHIEKYQNVQLSLLSQYERPLDSLGQDLLCSFAGETLTVKDIYQKHHVGTPFTKQNYKEALRRIEEENKILADPPAEKRRIIKGVRTLADTVKITFPPKN
ncbi:three-Cys-motif partner protein TcmP [Geobacillus subterraneus]|uniref:three-Cys-motif partner protein TcmP n=1 Tax=Geobacillus subterraneus TaxID=129338 RepID=UPI001442B04B|nr:three-Cys-motif partner protein TcmP [Geobacillus subterraneus]QIZ66659.1 three-Cys-motif partner protein TcmP [Geobacillus subterraneus]